MSDICVTEPNELLKYINDNLKPKQVEKKKEEKYLHQ